MPTKLDSSAPHLEGPAAFAGPLKDWGHQPNPIAGHSKSDGVLLHKGPDAFLKKIGEEATETVMAAKDCDHGGDTQLLVNEVADLWFHSMIALAHYGKSPADVVAELARREGLSGLEEKALRKAQAREASE